MRYRRHTRRVLVGAALLAALVVLSGCGGASDQAARGPAKLDRSEVASRAPADGGQSGGGAEAPAGSAPAPTSLPPLPHTPSPPPAISPRAILPQPVPTVPLPSPDAAAPGGSLRPRVYEPRRAEGGNPLRDRLAPRAMLPDEAAPEAEPALHFAMPEETAAEAAPREMFRMERASRDGPESAAEPAEAAGGETGKAASEKPPASEEKADYQVVTVYYGTDRNATAVGQGPNRAFLTWVYLAVGGAAVTVLLFGVAFLFSRRRLLLSTATLTLVATVMLAILSLVTWLQGRTLVDGPRVAYGNQRGQLEMGTCEVSIPKRHEVGELESPSVFRFEFVENPSRHVVLLEVEPEPADEFFSGLRARVEQSPRKEAFVFVHGFNVTFEDAARRTAQLAYDLKFSGAPIFYSWPSQGGLLKYAVDETNVVWTVPHLKEFVTAVARQSGAKSVHLIAHSMGNRALTAALKSLSQEMGNAPPMFNEVVLTAPDIDAEVFRRDIAPAIVKTAERVTLYASSNDEALLFSKQIHGYPRAGDTGGNLVVVPGIDTVDVSAVDTSLIGHDYYGDNDTVIADLMELVRNSKPPRERKWLETMRAGQLFYWIFRRDAPHLGSAGAAPHAY